MNKVIKVFFIGLLISAIGTLPLGTLNIIAMQLSVAEGYQQAIWFALGAAMVEMVYVRISLVGMDWIRKRKGLFRWLDWIAFLIVLVLAIVNFVAAANAHSSSHNAVVSQHINRFLLGLTMSALNPVQIPFWFGWSTVLFTKKMLEPNNRQYNFYITGIGSGTLIGFSIFIFGGQLFAKALEQNASLVSCIVGGVFAVTALIQLVKILRGKGVGSSLVQKPA